MVATTVIETPDAPARRVLSANPWSGGPSLPQDWINDQRGEGGVQYSRFHPLTGDAGGGTWVALGASEIRAVLIDSKTFISRGSTGVGQLLGEDIVLAPLESDAPDHQRLRGILQPLFQPVAVTRYRDRIRQLSEDLIARIEPRERCNFVEEFAVKLPTQIFLELFGLPVSDLPQFLEWEEIVMGRKTPERAAETWLAIRSYLERAIAARRAEPADDMLSHIVTKTTEQGVNPDAEAVGMAMILFVAGLDTVVTALGWIFRHLAANPADQARLRGDPAQIPAAVEELLRAYSFTTIMRTAATDVQIGGVTIRAGEAVACPTSIGSRDAVDYDDPARVDLDRGARRHLAFGFGQHICLGMHLARLELVTALECWLAAVPPFCLPQGYTPSSHAGISFGLDDLQLEW